MTVTAKPVLKNKFWIVEQEGVRVGTLSKNEEGFILAGKSSVEIFKSETALKKKPDFNSTLWYHLANAYYETGRLEEALESLTTNNKQ